MKKLPPIPQRKRMERIGAWIEDEYGYQKHVRSVNEFNYKVFVGQINHNNSYLSYIFEILLYYRFGKEYADTKEKFYDFLELDRAFRQHPYNTVMELYNYYSCKGALSKEIHIEIQETLQWLCEPYDKPFDEYDQFHAGQYRKQGREWIRSYYANRQKQ